MGKMSISRKDFSQAIQYCKHSIELETIVETKAIYYLGLADAYRNAGSFSNAREAAFKALELKNNWGEAYMNLGNIYVAGAKSCGNDFEQKIIKGRMNNEILQISHQNLKTGTLIKISNPKNKESLSLIHI